MLKRFIPLSKFLLVFCILLLVASGRIESSDGISALNVTRNIIKEKRFNIAPPAWSGGLQTTKGKDGLYYSPTSLGISLSYLPSALLTKAIYTRDNTDFPRYYPVQSDFLLEFLASFTNPILAFLLFIVNYKIFDLFIKNKNKAFFLSLIILFATNLFPLAKHSFSQIIFCLCVMASFYTMLLYLQNIKKNKYLILSGIFFGLALYSYNVIFILVFFVLLVALSYFLYEKRLSYREILIKCFLWAISAAPFLAIVCAFNYLRFGSILSTGYDLHAFDLTAKAVIFEGLWGLTLSSGKSFLVYSPILILALFLAIKHFKKDWSAKLFILLTTVLLLFYSRFVFWSGELSWGPRYMSLVIPFAGIVLARHFKEVEKMKIILTILIVVGLFVQLEGIVIPYQKQYRIFDFEILALPKNVTRNQQFEYWSIGEFIPRYSPIYFLKKDLIRDLFLIPRILKTSPSVSFAKDVSLPQKDTSGRYFKHGRSIMYLYSHKNFTFKTISFNLENLKDDIAKIGICIRAGCFTSDTVHKQGNDFTANFAKEMKIEKNEYANISLVSKNPIKHGFEFDIYSFSLGDIGMTMSEYSLANPDTFLVRNTPLFYDGPTLGFYKESRFYQDEVINSVPDFWWIRSKVYFNEPLGIRIFFITLLGLTTAAAAGTLISLKVKKN